MKYIFLHIFLRSIAFDAWMSSRTCDSISIARSHTELTDDVCEWMRYFRQTSNADAEPNDYYVLVSGACGVHKVTHSHTSCAAFSFGLQCRRWVITVMCLRFWCGHPIPFRSQRCLAFRCGRKKQKATQRLCGWKRLTTIIYCKKFAFRMATIDGDRRSRLKSLFRWNLLTFCSFDFIHVRWWAYSQEPCQSGDTRLDAYDRGRSSHSWDLRWKGGN